MKRNKKKITIILYGNKNSEKKLLSFFYETLKALTELKAFSAFSLTIENAKKDDY